MKIRWLSTMMLRTIPIVGVPTRVTCVQILCSFFLGAFALSAFAGGAPGPAHGLWVWKIASVLGAPHGAEDLVAFCRSEGINEVYVSVSERGEAVKESELAHLIALLHPTNIRVEALFSSTDADEPGTHRETLLRHVQEIVRFNQRNSANGFDGIHLDIEPQQRPENKGPGNLRFLPGLADAYRAVRAVAEPAGMTVNADIEDKLLKGDLAERKMLLSAVPRVTLMMFGLSTPGDGESVEQKAEKVQKASQKFLDIAYDGLGEPNLARMAIALRTTDYGELLAQMLKKIDDVNGANPRYRGWAWEAYIAPAPRAPSSAPAPQAPSKVAPAPQALSKGAHNTAAIRSNA
jgi:hypothetical protein